MPPRAKKFAFLILGLLLIVLILLAVILTQEGKSNSQNISNLKIHYFDIGQGDSVLIETPYEQRILIDGGPDNTVVRRLGEALPFFERNIDVMILSHPHSDHVTGLVEVLKRYKVEKIYHTGVLHTSSDYLRWLELIKQKKIDMQIIKTSFDLELGEDLKLEFLYPLRDLTDKKVENLNNASIVNRLVYKNRSFLFTGDAEKEVEEELLSKDFDLKADVLKAGHHGSSSSSAEEFLKAVNPQFAVIQCGRDNDFGHPHLRVIRNLEDLGIGIKRNDLQGTITVLTDGNNLEIK